MYIDYKGDKMSSMIRAAFATNNSKNIDAHFGKAKQFDIYEISCKKSTFLKSIANKQKDTDKTIALLEDIDIVYFINVGPIAATKVIKKGIFPIKYKDIVSIEDELKKLESMLSKNPPPFIKKILQERVA